jgi:peptidoglycan/LPS O-acetylase OafA/YrhL
MHETFSILGGGEAQATKAKWDLSFVPELESARGIAASMVVGFHVMYTPLVAHGTIEYLFQKDDKKTILTGVLRILYLLMASGFGLDVTPAVLFFFVLSGFVLTGALHRRWVNVSISSFDFLISRLFRLFPAIISTIALFWIAFEATGRNISDPRFYTFSRIILNALLLEDGIDGVMWTIQVEMIAVVVVFLMYCGYLRFGSRFVVDVGIVLGALVFSTTWENALTLPGGPSRVLYLYAFAFGAIAFHALREYKLPAPAYKWMAWISIIAIVLLPAIGSTIYPPILEFPFDRPDHLVTSLLLSLAAMGIVLSLASGHSGMIGGFLRFRVFRFLGKISYSLYVLHPLAFLVIWKMPATTGAIVDAGLPRALVAFGLWAATMVVIVPLAWASWRFVEMPGQRLGNLILRALISRREIVPHGGQDTKVHFMPLSREQIRNSMRISKRTVPPPRAG